MLELISKKIYFVIISAAAMLFAIQASAVALTLAQAQPAEATSEPQAQTISLPEIKKVGIASTFTLANGLAVVVIEDHRAPVVTQMIWYHAGSADEPKGRSGIAHFLEHLMFKGTPTHPEGEFSKFIASVGGEENAFTSYDYTAFYQRVAPQYLKKIMALEADRMQNLSLSDDAVNTERKVIIEERRMRVDNNPNAMLDEETRATLFLNSPYHNPVIGWMQEMETLSRDDAIAFYRKFYTPNNATLVLSGDVEAENVRDIALATFGKLQPTHEVKQRVRAQEPVSRTIRSVTLHDPRIKQPSFQQMWIVPSYHNGNEKNHEAEALDLLGEILGGSSRSRLYQKFVVDNDEAAIVGSAYGGDAVDDGVFYVYAMPRGTTSVANLQAAIIGQIDDIRKNGVSEKELNQARNRFINHMVFSRDNPTDLAKIYGSALAVGLSVDDVANRAERLKTVTVNDVKAVAARYLDPERSVSSYLLPPIKKQTKSTDRKKGSE